MPPASNPCGGCKRLAHLAYQDRDLSQRRRVGDPNLQPLFGAGSRYPGARLLTDARLRSALAPPRSLHVSTSHGPNTDSIAMTAAAVAL
jgi:hypothetical protein